MQNENRNVQTTAGAHIIEPPAYSLWNDPDFWNVCELIADHLIEKCKNETPQLSAPQCCVTSENQWCEKALTM